MLPAFWQKLPAKQGGLQPREGSPGRRGVRPTLTWRGSLSPSRAGQLSVGEIACHDHH